MLLPLLLDRCESIDSIREFRLAAAQRYTDAVALAAANRRLAAIYLWGYAAEMTLKAAYFSLINYTDIQRISVNPDLKAARKRGEDLKVVWPKEEYGHNVRAWAELLVNVRALNGIKPYPRQFGLEVQRQGQRIEALWRVTLRYRHIDVYFCEVVQMREAAKWFLEHSNEL